MFGCKLQSSLNTFKVVPFLSRPEFQGVSGGFRVGIRCLQENLGKLQTDFKAFQGDSEGDFQGLHGVACGRFRDFQECSMMERCQMRSKTFHEASGDSLTFVIVLTVLQKGFVVCFLFVCCWCFSGFHGASYRFKAFQDVSKDFKEFQEA